MGAGCMRAGASASHGNAPLTILSAAIKRRPEQRQSFVVACPKFHASIVRNAVPWKGTAFAVYSPDATLVTSPLHMSVTVTGVDPETEKVGMSENLKVMSVVLGCGAGLFDGTCDGRAYLQDHVRKGTTSGQRHTARARERVSG